MQVIKVIIEHMHDTLEEAHEYYRDYVIFKEQHPKAAQTSLEMAQVHLNLYLKWHDVIVSLINDYKAKENEIPETMQKLYNYEHEKLVEEYDELNYKIKNAKNF